MGKSMLLIISVATLHSLCHGSPLGIGNVDLKLRTPEGRNFNPVQFAEEWVDSVSLPVIPVVKNLEIVPVPKAVPVPFRSTPVLVQRESIPRPVVVQNIQPAAIIPEPTVRAAPLIADVAPVDVESTAKSASIIIEPPSIVVEHVLKPVPVNVKFTPVVVQPVKAAHVVIEPASIIVERVERPAPVVKSAVEEVSFVISPIVQAGPVKAAHVVIEPASIIVEPVEKPAPVVKSAVEEVSSVISPIVQAGPAVVSPAFVPLVKKTPVIVETVVKSITPVVAPKIIETEPIEIDSFVKPSVNIISPAAPIIKNTPAKGSIPILRPIPVVASNSIQIVEPTSEFIIAEDPVPINVAAIPAIKATPEVIALPVVNTSPEVISPSQIITLPVASATPELIVAVAPEPLDAPNPPSPTPDVPFRGGQFHAQDEAGQYAFGYYGGSSTRVEAKDSLGRVSGSFAYVNPDGDVQIRKYSSAPGVGFKVAASDLPVDTPEVAEVKEAHEKLIADTRASKL